MIISHYYQIQIKRRPDEQLVLYLQKYKRLMGMCFNWYRHLQVLPKKFGIVLWEMNAIQPLCPKNIVDMVWHL